MGSSFPSSTEGCFSTTATGSFLIFLSLFLLGSFIASNIIDVLLPFRLLRVFFFEFESFGPFNNGFFCLALIFSRLLIFLELFLFLALLLFFLFLGRSFNCPTNFLAIYYLESLSPASS